MNEHLTTVFIAREMAARGYTVIPGPDVSVTGGSADSRTTRPGDVFAAFRGENVDGNVFVAEALANGAVAAVCERAPAGGAADKTLVVAPDTTRAMAELATAWRRECSPRVVGITGTVGKTTAKDVTAAVLATQFRTHKSEGNLNSREGLPLALMSLRRDDEVSVLEMGMDSPGEILELCAIAEPEVGVVLNVGLTHVSKLGSIQAIAREKLSLVRWLPETGTAVLNADDPWIAPVAGELHCRVITFAGAREAAPHATLTYTDIRSEGLAGTRFFLTTGKKSARVDSPLPGEHTIPGVVAAVGVAMALGMRLFDAANAVRNSGLTGRVRTLPGRDGSTIVDDRYNSSPASLAGALAVLGDIRAYRGTRTIALLGKMAELGEFEAEEHRKAGRLAASSCDILVAVGEPCRALIEEAKAAGHADARWFEDKDEAAAAVSALLREGDTVLVKASRSQAFETILPRLAGES